MRRWPLFVIALPAAVAVWSGWVGLGGLCGFGLVQPLPGIVRWHLDTAITLPIGVEAYATYALGGWLTPGVPDRARAFARRSAVGALVLGMAGQVIYHLLAAAHRTRAPWPVVVLVACLPVVTLGFGAGLTHLLREHAPVPGSTPAVPAAVSERAPGTVSPDTVPDRADAPAEPESAPVPAAPENAPDVPVSAPAVSVDAPESAPATSAVPAVPESAPAPGYALNGHGHEAERIFAGDLAAGDVPSIRRIRSELRVGQPRAKEIQAHLETLTPAGRDIARIRDEIRQAATTP